MRKHHRFADRRSRMQRLTRRQMMLESLEDRRLLAITAGGPGGFELPVPTSDLEIWLDASDVNADGSAAANGALVANWQDKSGNDRDFNDILGDPNYVTAGSNGRPTINFDGDDALRTNLTTSNPRNFIDGNGEFTLISVARYSGADRERVIAARTGHNWLFGYHGGGVRRWHYDNWGSLDVGGYQNDTNWHLHANLMNVTNVPTNPAGDFYLDGTLLTDNGTGTADSFANNVPDGLSLGAWNGLGESSTAEVSELVMYNRVLNDLEHRIVQNYLSSKYDINIGSLDMYAGDTAGNGDYDLNVIGIGRQNAATVVLSGGQAGFGIEAPASIADDGDYVFAGHKQTVNSFVTAGIPSSVARRWSRAWNVEVTDINNNVGATVAFDYSDSGLAIGSANAFKLLRSIDGGTTWVDVGATANVQGDAITFSLSAAQLSSALYTLGDSARPLVLNSPGAANYVIGAAALAIDPSLVLTAGGSPTMTGATISVAGFVGGDADVLALPAPVGGITGSYNSATGVLTLSGTDTAANYQAALRSVTFAKASYQAMPLRALNFSVTDSAGQIGTSSRGVAIAATAAANIIQWDGASDADGDGVNWSDPFNWAGDVLPDANDVALFAGLATGTINVSSAVVVGSISFTNSGAAYTVQSTGGSLQLTSAASTISQTGTTSNTISNAVNFAGVGMGIDVAAATTLTLSGDLSGTGNLDKNGLGAVVLSGTNTYTGATNINTGTLRLAGLVVPQVPAGAVAVYTFDSVSGATVNNFGTVSAAENGILVGGATVVGGGISGNAMSTVGGVGARMEIGTSPGISLAGGNWTGAAWFNGIYPTTDWRTLFRGGVGEHQIIIESGSNNLGMFANSGAFRDSGYDLPTSVTGWHHIAAVGSGITTTFFVDGVQVGVSDRNSLTDIFSVGAYQGGSQRFAQLIDDVYVYQKALTPADVLKLYQSGAGIAGVGSKDSIPNSSRVNIAGGAFLDLNGISETIGSLAGSGTVTSGVVGNATLTTGSDNTNASFGGVIQNGAGVVSLAKTGTGIQTLTAAQTYTGATNIENGTLQLAGGANRLPVGTILTLGLGSTGGILDLNNQNQQVAGLISSVGSVNRVIDSTNDATFPTLTVDVATGSNSFTGVLGNANQNGFNLAKSGSGTLVLSGVNTFTGKTAVLGGTLSINADAALGTAPAAAVADQITLANNSTLAATATFTLNANRGITLGAGGGQINTTGVLTYGGVITGAGGLTKVGAGTLTLAGANTFTGKTAILAGTLTVGADAAFGTAPGSAVADQITIANNALLVTTAGFVLNANRGITLGAGGGQINISGGLSYGGNFSGGTGLTKLGAGDLILSTAGTTNPGLLNINAGRVFFDSQNALGLGGVNINNTGTLDYQGGAPLTLANTVVIASGGNIASRFAQLTSSATLPTSGLLIVNQDDQNTSTVVLTSGIALAGALEIRVGGGGGNGGVARLDGLISGSATLTKTQTGVLHLNNAANSFTSIVNVNVGTLRVSTSGALGSIVGVTNVPSGSTLEFNGAFDYALAEPINISGAGVGGVGAINKVGGNGVLSTLITLIGNATIGSGTAGATLTINPNINLGLGNLTFTGAGDIQMNGALLVPASLAVANLNSVTTGDYSYTAQGQTFNARVDNVGGVGWLLVGRGREGWQFDNDGQGLIADVNQNLGTSLAFTPAAYSDAIVNDLLNQSGLNLANVEIRLKRASVADGSAYQESRLRSFSVPSWSWVFSNPGTNVQSGGFTGVTREIVSGPGSPSTITNQTTIDSGPNDFGRIFTWPWDGHASQRGFSYGSSVNLVAGPSATNFLWESGGEQHEIPYTEVYVRSLIAAPVGGNAVIKNGTGTVTLAGSNNYAGATTVNAGRLVVTANNALGTTAGTTNVVGGELLFANNVNYSTPETINVSALDAAVVGNLSGTNTFAGSINTWTMAGVATGTFSGGDVGEGLDLDGNFMAAVNARGPGSLQVRSALFTDQASEPDVTIVAQNEIINWQNPSFGATTNDDNLEVVMQSIRWSGNPNTVNISLNNLTPGAGYKVQLLFYEPGNAGRGFDIFFDGNLVVDNYTAGVGGTNGAVVTYAFVATAATHAIVLNGAATPFGDKNPILQGVTVEAQAPVNVISYAGALTVGGPVNIGLPGLVTQGAGNLIFNGALTSSTLLKSGTGALTLSNGGNSLSGTTISQGTVFLAHPDALGTGAVAINDANTGANNTALLATFGNLGNSIINNITVANQGTGTTTIGTTSFNPGAQPTLYAGSLTLNRATILHGGSTDRTTYLGAISGSGAITVTGPGTPGVGGNRTTLDNNSNSFTGNIAIAGTGTTLQLNGTSVVPDSVDIDVAAGNYLYLNTASETIDALSGAGTVQIHPSVPTSSVLTVGAGNSSFTFSGVIANGGSGGATLSITKTGGGVWYVDGNNTYNGLTTINGGYLVARNNTALGTTVGGTVVTNPGTLQLEALSGNVNIAGEALTISGLGVGGTRGALASWTGTNSFSGPITIAGNTSMYVFSGNLELSGVIQGAAGLTNTKIGAGSINYTGTASNTFAGTTILDLGMLSLAKTGGAVAISGPVQMGGGNGNQPTLRMEQANQFASGVVMSGIATQTANARFDLQGFNQTLAGLVSPNSFLMVQNEKFGGGGTAQDATLTLDGSGTYVFNGGFLRDEEDGGHVYKLHIVKSGSGTQTFAGANINYQGATTVTGGTLILSNTNNWASNIANSATVELHSTLGNYNLGNGRTFSGNGTYRKTGTGQISLFQSIITASGNIEVQAGTLRNDGNSVNWSGSTANLDVSSGATFDMRADSVWINALTGGGAIANSFGGGGIDTLTIGVNGGNSLFSGSIGGSGTGATLEGNGRTGLTKVGAGVLLLNGANTYTGPTLVNAGALGGSGSLTSDITVANLATLSPGGTPGTLTTTGNTTLQTGSIYRVELIGLTNDRLVTNGVDLTDAVLDASSDSNLGAGTPFVIIDNTSGAQVIGTFAGLPENASFFINGYQYFITYEYGVDGNDVAIIRNQMVDAIDDQFGPILVNTSFTGNTYTNDSDPDGDARSTVIAQPLNGKVFMDPATGVFTYTPKPNFIGTDSFTYRLSDGEFNDTAIVEIIVAPLLLDGNGVLQVGGTTGGDNIIVQAGSIRYNNTTYPLAASRVVVHGGGGNDTISVTASNIAVEFYGDDGDDYLSGGSLNDILDGGAGTDRLLGNAGDDRMYGGGGSDNLSGGVGNDYLSGDGYLDTSSVEQQATDAGKDTLSGDAGDDEIHGGAGMDTLLGGIGNDYLSGGEDGDAVDGGAGHDILLGGGGGDKLYGRAGNDVLIGGAGLDTLLGDTGLDLVYGGDVTASLSEATLRAIALQWFTPATQTAAVNQLLGYKQDDLVSDTLNGEADDDWYLIFAKDLIATTERFPGNRKTQL